MSIIKDQQLIESLSDQDLARLIQGEVPQLAHLASIGVSETTRRLDFRREYQEELDRLDNPLGQEDISTQMAMKLLSGGVPTVNEGVTDEFPQGGIAGQQQAPQQQATQQAAAPQQGAATQAAAPQAAAAPAAAPAAGGAGAVPGMAFGGPVTASIPPWLLWSLIGSAAGTVGGPLLRAGSKYISPAIKRQLAKIKPAMRSGAGRVAPRGYRQYPSGPVRKEKYPWMGQGIKGKWPRGKKGETPISIPQRPGTTASYEDRGRMLLGDVIGNVKPLALSSGIGGISGGKADTSSTKASLQLKSLCRREIIEPSMNYYLMAGLGKSYGLGRTTQNILEKPVIQCGCIASGGPILLRFINLKDALMVGL